MKHNIKVCISALMILGLFTAIGLAEPPPTVTVSTIIYKGTKFSPTVTVSTIVYKGKKISTGQAPSMAMSIKKNQMDRQVKIVLLSPQGQTFKVGARVPVTVNVFNPPEVEPEPDFEFQQRNGQNWRSVHGQRVTGNAVKRFKDKITLTRYVQFGKAGEYRWRCQINQGAWSAWSNPVTILDPNTRAAPAVRESAPERNTNTRQ